MANIEKFPLEARGETVSREALVQAALHEITQNYREASLSNVARSYGVSLAYVSECVRAQTGKTYKELLQKHRMETAARLLRRSDWNIQQIITYSATRTPATSTAFSMSGMASAPGSTAAAAPRASGPAHEYARLLLKDVLPLCAVHLFLCREVPAPQNLEIAGRLCYYDRNDAVCGERPGTEREGGTVCFVERPARICPRS